MSHLTWRRLAAWAGVSLALAWALGALLLGRGNPPVTVPLSLPLGCLIAGGIAIWTGWTVRSYQRGDRHHLAPLRALRTAAFAQACAYTGAVLGGVFGGYALSLLAYWDHAPRRQVAIEAFVAAGAALLMLVAGIVAERWCRIDDDSDDASGADAGAAPA
ncbi:DUF3180 domain-containing protein [Demequina salsinemoris]|uniref:DUF3180 domain-containing protein n=1 Tax=Demequina salsinemoris TaxID=577470 RepID=UPI0007844119|nr:DUF3180 domain-containing protein [Demequina salsinemoris]